ncbi:hypothetical protein EDD85DRAFT_941158 [Armillaria nabsnona]|nr:hypothetical protein EDD85DRAFT_941158 [Armillaria nabsnona]
MRSFIYLLRSLRYILSRACYSPLMCQHGKTCCVSISILPPHFLRPPIVKKTSRLAVPALFYNASCEMILMTGLTTLATSYAYQVQRAVLLEPALALMDWDNVLLGFI